MTNRQGILAMMMVLLAICGPATAFAASANDSAHKTPPLTKDFVKFCQASTADCADAISLAEATLLLNTSGQAVVCVPAAASDKDGLTPDSVHMIVRWITDHPDLADRSTQKAIEAAMKAEWPWTKECAAQFSDALPKLTGAFADYCSREGRAHMDDCMDAITNVSLAEMLKDPPTYCLPDSASATDDAEIDQIVGVIKWLKDHKELAAQPRNASIVAAYRALYPCSNK